MASDVKWIKIVTDVFDDEKILLVESIPEADAIIVIWFKLLCFAGKQNNGGVFMLNDKLAYTDEMLATIFRRPLNTVRLALNTFERFGMIEIIDNVITIPNWEKHQNINALERMKEQTRKRVAAHRDRQKQLTQCNASGNVTVTKCNATDKEEDKEKEGDKDNSNISGEESPKIDFKKEFETLWKIYPNKKGKDKALSAYIKARKKGVAFETVEAGIKAYIKECDIKERDKQYIKHGSTWFNNAGWDDEYDLMPNRPQGKQTNAHNYTRRETTPSWMNDDIYTDLTELDDEDQAKADALAEKMKEKYGKDSA